MNVRLDSYLAHMGLGSRRAIGSLLKMKVVTVNGSRVFDAGTRVEPDKDVVLYEGKPIETPEKVYYLLNKPAGIISTVSDERHRKNVVSLVPHVSRVYPVGRLDKDTTGLILLTNDGDLANRLTHPRYEVEKTYRVTVSGSPRPEQVEQMRNGIALDGKKTAPATIVIQKKLPQQTIFDITLHEGRNRQVRRMCEVVGLRLEALQRIKLGPLTLDFLPEGKYRGLTEKEIAVLKNQ